MRILPTPKPEDVLQGAKHILYVEGPAGGVSLDSIYLSEFLAPVIKSVRPLGPCFSIASVAESMREEHPSYYFLIDRDHQDDSRVQKAWDDFLSGKANLLIWRKRELENYFLDPPLLASSPHTKGDEQSIADEMLRIARERFWMECANQVIISIREEQKQQWIGLFSRPKELQDEGTARRKLLERTEWRKRSRTVTSSVEVGRITTMFDQTVEEWSGGRCPIEFGHGIWPSRMSGKSILRMILGGRLFVVKDTTGKPVQGPKKVVKILKDLGRQHAGVEEANQVPRDFLELREALRRRVLGR